jgi:crotonobetainyl-CoA:carnitine CoA-transferase CaiB-like acyl-CoA transferase
MTGVFDGLRVLDLSRGIAGPMTAMLLADAGADVVRVEPPDGDGFGHLSGYVVWNRGKRTVRMDLKDPDVRAEFLRMVEQADVLLETYRPGVTSRLGIDHATLDALNPRLVYASITGYGRDNPHSERPGMQWDQRSYYGTRMEHIMGTDAATSSFPVPEGVEQTGGREGPIFLAVPWASIGAMLLTITGISSALYVRERTGRGQLFETSLLQAAIMENAMGWQRVAKMHPSYRLWYFDRRAPKGIFRTGDDKWLHQWAPFEHDFIRDNAAAAAAGSTETSPVVARPRLRGALTYEQEVEFQAEQYFETAKAVATLPRDEWVRRFAEVRRAAQPILSPEEGLMDLPLEREGVIVELHDPVHGRIRQIGHPYVLEGVPHPPIRPRPSADSAVTAVLADWQPRAITPSTELQPLPAAPLTGVVVLDFGLAIAGPYGPQILADHGATVIKVTALDFSLTDAIYVGSSHGKLAIALDLKHPRGLEVAQRLIRRADVVHHNMRTGVAERLGIGYEQAKELNGSIVYCHTRGFEKDGPRTPLPGNDQMGHALAGTQYEAGGTHHGTAPIWHTIAFGDAGTGILSAAAVVQALIHRDKTGEGQFVHASIVNTCLLYNSSTFAYADGTGPDRERIDAQQFGFSALRRLYETTTEWLCIYARHDADRAALLAALGLSPTVVESLTDDAALAEALTAVFRSGAAADWFGVLDAAGVPCEISSSTFARELFDDPEMHQRGWVIANDHDHLDRVEQVGMSFSFSATPAMNLAGAPVTGQHSRAILADLGYAADEVDALIADGVVGDRQPAG